MLRQWLAGRRALDLMHRSGPKMTPDGTAATIHAAFPVEEQGISGRGTGKFCSTNRDRQERSREVDRDGV